jgi:hypothetical protein
VVNFKNECGFIYTFITPQSFYKSRQFAQLFAEEFAQPDRLPDKRASVSIVPQDISQLKCVSPACWTCIPG